MTLGITPLMYNNALMWAMWRITCYINKYCKVGRICHHIYDQKALQKCLRACGRLRVKKSSFCHDGMRTLKSRTLIWVRFTQTFHWALKKTNLLKTGCINQLTHQSLVRHLPENFDRMQSFAPLASWRGSVVCKCGAIHARLVRVEVFFRLHQCCSIIILLVRHWYSTQSVRLTRINEWINESSGSRLIGVTCSQSSEKIT